MQQPSNRAVVIPAVVAARRASARIAFLGEDSQLSVVAPADGNSLLLSGGSRDDPKTLRARLARFSPEVVVVLRPELLPPGALARLDAITVGYLTEPLHPQSITGVERGNFDRVIAADARIAADTELAGVNVWRVLAPPVADRFYRRARLPARPPRVLEIGRGCSALQLAGQLDRNEVALNVERSDHPVFEHLVVVCMAAGLLALSRPLTSIPALEADIDYVSIDDELRVAETLETLRRDPAAYHRQLLGGRMKAEWMRASRVWSRVVGDLRRDIAAFGRGP